MKNKSFSGKIFMIVNVSILIFLTLICVLPLINVLSISFSSSAAASAGKIKLLPVDFNISSYKYVLSKHEFIISLIVSFKRLFLGVIVNMILTILVAYPLSKDNKTFRSRSIYTWFFLITILFSGGLIPTYMVLRSFGILDTIWALILPGAVPVFNVILLLNFFKEVPIEIEEAAFIDGAGPWLSLLKIYIPLSTPSLATIVLFCAVGHWNSWFDGLIYMNNPSHYPLQSYLQTVIINTDMSRVSASQLKDMALISDRTTKAAQIFIGAIPILCVYPFLQKYFTKGMTLGSVKG